MTSIAKLKDRARKHELKEDWQAAIDAYQKVLQAEEQKDELELELGLFNRVGDLYLRLGQTDQAVKYYEMAADKYAESGFFNNAIALCNKALRHRPQRPQLYLKLSRLCLDQGFLPDARRWMLDYADRQVKAGKLDEALTALEDFADDTGDADVRELLSRYLANQDRTDEAVAQLRLAHAAFARARDEEGARRAAGRARELDPGVELDTAAALAGDGAEGADVGTADASPEDPELVLETHRQDASAPEDVGGLEGLESGAGLAGPDDEDEVPDQPGALPGLEPTADETEPSGAEAAGAGVSDLETFSAEEDPDAEVLDAPGEGVEPVAGSGLEREPDEDEEPLPLLDTGFGDEPGEDAEPLPLLDGSDAEEVDEEPVDTAPEPSEEGPEVEEPVGGEPTVEEPEAEESVEEPEEEPEEEPVEAAGEPGELGDLASLGRIMQPDEVPSAAGTGDEAEEEDPTAAARKYGIEPMDLDMTELSFGPSDMTGDPTDPFRDVDVDTVVDRARELVARALFGEALRELSILSGAEASSDAFRAALGVASEIVRHDPNNISALQARVDFASQTKDTELTVGAHLDLADALARLGSETKAQAMYERVLDLDPENEAARDALGAPVGGGEEPVDLDPILREIEPEGGSARTMDKSDPQFAALLSQLRSRVTERSGGGSPGDHYDLGLAFKEMGLIDEAINEFQTALRAGEEGLRVYEELGQCFVLKRQYTVALKVFTRALQLPHEDEADLLGVYYLLGQCYEELGQREDAREAYEKVLAIDESFADVPDRVARL